MILQSFPAHKIAEYLHKQWELAEADNSPDVWHRYRSTARVREALAFKLAIQGYAMLFVASFGYVIAHRSKKPGYAWQITSLDKQKRPLCDTVHKSAFEAFREALDMASTEKITEMEEIKLWREKEATLVTYAARK